MWMNYAIAVPRLCQDIEYEMLYVIFDAFCVSA